jgi:hypothetical protein
MVEYCAEQFDNDGSLLSKVMNSRWLMKSPKPPKAR